MCLWRCPQPCIFWVSLNLLPPLVLSWGTFSSPWGLVLFTWLWTPPLMLITHFYARLWTSATIVLVTHLLCLCGFDIHLIFTNYTLLSLTVYSFNTLHCTIFPKRISILWLFHRIFWPSEGYSTPFSLVVLGTSFNLGNHEVFLAPIYWCFLNFNTPTIPCPF